MRYEMLGDDGQGYQLWEAESGSLGRVRYNPDTGDLVAVDADCDGWDQDKKGYEKMAEGELVGLKMAFLVRKAASALGSIRTPKKAESSRENGKKGGRPRSKPA